MNFGIKLYCRPATYLPGIRQSAIAFAHTRTPPKRMSGLSFTLGYHGHQIVAYPLDRPSSRYEAEQQQQQQPPRPLCLLMRLFPPKHPSRFRFAPTGFPW